jgi:hypothetical protein
MNICRYEGNIYIEKITKKVSSKSNSQFMSTNQTHDLGHEIAMTPYIQK